MVMASRGHRVMATDFGIKKNILEHEVQCKTTVQTLSYNLCCSLTEPDSVLLLLLVMTLQLLPHPQPQWPRSHSSERRRGMRGLLSGTHGRAGDTPCSP